MPLVQVPGLVWYPARSKLCAHVQTRGVAAAPNAALAVDTAGPMVVVVHFTHEQVVKGGNGEGAAPLLRTQEEVIFV